MGPLVGAALGAVSPISKAIEQINKLIELIAEKKITVNDSEYYRRWLEVAMLAIQGLEGEYEAILQQAYGCDITDAKQKSDLENRINGYINGEHLRPKLKEALGHLKKGQDVLKEHAERLLLWPNTKRTREDALREYAQHVNELEGYLGSLGDYTGGSAVALNDIQLLLRGASGFREAFRAIAEVLQNNRDKSNLFAITERAAETISLLRAAFR
jgi:hypothetical protein